MYIYIYVYVCIYYYTFMYIYIIIHIYIYIYIYVCVYIYNYTYIYTYICMYIDTLNRDGHTAMYQAKLGGYMEIEDYLNNKRSAYNLAHHDFLKRNNEISCVNEDYRTVDLDQDSVIHLEDLNDLNYALNDPNCSNTNRSTSLLPVLSTQQQHIINTSIEIQMGVDEIKYPNSPQSYVSTPYPSSNTSSHPHSPSSYPFNPSSNPSSHAANPSSHPHSPTSNPSQSVPNMLLQDAFSSLSLADKCALSKSLSTHNDRNMGSNDSSFSDFNPIKLCKNASQDLHGEKGENMYLTLFMKYICI
jgi:hypothetical protein